MIIPDFVGPICHQGKKLYLLTIIDHFTRLGIDMVTQNTLGSTATNAFEKWCSDQNIILEKILTYGAHYFVSG